MAGVRAIAAAYMGLWAVGARADLNQIPTADVVGHREGLLELLAEGSERRIDPRYYFSHRVRVGLFDRIELGYSNDFEGETAVNVRALLVEQGVFSLSVGTDGMRLGQRADLYAVALYDLSRVRLHAGIVRNDRLRPMVGVDFDLPRGITGMVDYVAGPGGATWAGLDVPLPVRGLSLYAAAGVPNVRAEGVQHTAGLYYGFNF